MQYFKSISIKKLIKCVENQTGGNKIYKITYYKNKLNDIYNKINIASIE